MSTSAFPPNIYSSRCGSRKALDLVADKWTVLIVRALEDGPQRYEQLHRRIDGVSKRMLTHTLREMQRNGLVHREVYPEASPKVEYWLTPLGDTLRKPLGVLATWAMTHLDDVLAAHASFDRQGSADRT